MFLLDGKGLNAFASRVDLPMASAVSELVLFLLLNFGHSESDKNDLSEGS